MHIIKLQQTYMKKIILASSSPRRQEVLKNIGLDFDIIVSDYKEDMTLNMTPEKLAEYLSLGKAMDVVHKYPNAIIIAADTFVVLDHDILGKPATKEIAKKTLQTISNQTIDVITGYTVIDTMDDKIITKSVTTQVVMKKMTPEEITAYIKTDEPMDKAGAFGIQGHGALLVKEIHGDYYNVMGLPLFSLTQSLKELNIELL